MSNFKPSGHGRLALKFCLAASAAALMGGCSTDVTRLSDPFSNPFSTASNDPAPQPMPTTRGVGRTPPVMSQALPPRNSSYASSAPLRPRVVTAYNNAPVSHETTGSIESEGARASSGASYAGWTSSGGVAVTVGSDESAEVLSKRYGVPTAALLQTNGYRSAADVRPGSRLTIPVYNAVAASQQSWPRVARAEPARSVAESTRIAEARPSRPLAKAALLKPKSERVAAAETRTQGRLVAPAKPLPATKVVAEKPHPSHAARAELGSAKTVQAKAEPIKAEPSKVAPGKVAAARQASLHAAPVAAPATTTKVAMTKPAPVRTAALAPTAVEPAPAKGTVAAAPAKPVQAVVKPEAAPSASAAPAAPVSDASGNPEFRWPARGRIIQGFKGGSGGNDGINIAVPEGTAVKAAEGGTVAYAGSELKGYGNLVLIRHPNGFVTAYANNGELDVKRGDQVKRGQTIAKSGQSGNVASPQLHFELRKGSTPVDPTQYLAGL